MTYIVRKIDAGRWQLSNQYGTNLGVHGSRKEAVTIGRALAGWRGTVMVER